MVERRQNNGNPDEVELGERTGEGKNMAHLLKIMAHTTQDHKHYT
jgi:hypothetical protein